MSIFDNDIDVIDTIKDDIKKFIKSNYTCNKGFIISDKPNKNGLYEVSSDGNIEIPYASIASLTNGLFEWNEVKGYFNCNGCTKLTSLEGAPKKVHGRFDCFDCVSLKTLEGGPEYVGGNFNCAYCTDLISLKGAPKIVCNSFLCYCCYKLKSLEYIPKVIKNLDCNLCSVTFSKEYIDFMTKVEEYIL